MFQKFVNWFKAEVEQALQAVKIVSLLATLVGAYYFAAYLASLGVPFPADFSVLPSVLLAVGVTTLGITSLVLIYVLLAGWIQMDPLDMGYAELVHTRHSGLIGHGGRAALMTIVAIYIVPFLAWVAVLFSAPEKEAGFYLVILLAGFAIWACIIAFAKVREKKEEDTRKRKALFGKISFSIFILSFLTVISSVVYITLVHSLGLMETWYHMAMSLTAFATINVGVIYPAINVSEFNKVNNEALEEGRLDADALTKNIYKAPVLSVIGVLVVVTLIPPFPAYLGELTVKLLGLSSNEPRVIYTDLETGKIWPPVLRDSCKVDSCQSMPVSVVLDLGKYLYVKPKENGKLYRIERTKIVEEFLAREDDKTSSEALADSRG